MFSASLNAAHPDVLLNYEKFRSALIDTNNASLLMALPPMAATLLDRTAPQSIYLQVSDNSTHLNEPFPKDVACVTWTSLSALECEVKYIRSDLIHCTAFPAIHDVNERHHSEYHQITDDVIVEGMPLFHGVHGLERLKNHMRETYQKFHFDEQYFRGFLRGISLANAMDAYVGAHAHEFVTVGGYKEPSL